MVVPEVRAILESRPSLKSVVIFGIEVMRLFLVSTNILQSA